MTLRRWHRNHRILPTAMALLSVCTVVVLSGAAGASYHGTPSRTPTATTRVGSLTVVDAFLPEPPSPAVAAIYLTVRNSGSRSDALIGVSTAVAGSSMLMTEYPNGTMGMLGQLRIPAHGEASLVPGHDHLMLEQPTHTLTLGQHIAVTLHFRRAGFLTISVPVVPLSRILTRG
jgi:periplasmic copper chaperone A